MTEPGTRTQTNYLYAIISVALVLFLIGFFGLLLLHARQLIGVYKERVNILVEMKQTASRAEVDSLQVMLREQAYIKSGSVQYIDKESASVLMQKEFGEDFLKLDLPNPFFDVLSFNVKASYMDRDSLESIRQQIRQRSSVSDVFYQENLISDVGENLRNIGYIALGIGVFFIIVAVTLIHNTVRLSLYANRFLIKNMQLVGASWGFISRPYLWRSVGHGFIASVISVSALAGFLYWIRSDIPELSLLEDSLQFVVLFLGLILLGVLIYTFSTYYVVNKYLKMRVDDLYR